MTSLTIRRTLIAVCLAGLLGGGVAMAQTGPTSAQDEAVQAPVVDQAQPQEAVAQAPAVDQAAVAQSDAKKRMADRNCLRYTGSRIRSYDPATGKRPCMAGPGSAYSKDTIDSTGQVDLAKALRQLDPAVSVSGH